MTQSVLAIYNGNVLVPQEPVDLPVLIPLDLRIAVSKKRLHRTIRKRKIVGIGKYRSGISDLGSNKNHLEGFGK
jgi:hypothetical protein